MLSRKSTLILAIIAIIAGSLAAINLSSRSLGLIFGSTPEPAGRLLYRDFELSDVEEMIIEKGKNENGGGGDARRIERAMRDERKSPPRWG